MEKINLNKFMSCLPFILITLFITAVKLSATNLFMGEKIEKVNSTVNVKDFGAKGDGVADDTDAIIEAVEGTVGLVEFPRGSYRITKTIDINLSENGPLGLSGSGGSARIIIEGDGPAFRFTGSHRGTASPASVTPLTWEKERMPVVKNLEIVGGHPGANGLEFCRTMQPVISSVLIREVHHGIHFTSRNRNIIISDSHVYNNSGVGVLLDSVNIHQILISNCHISYNKLGGIKVTSKSEIRNFHITGNAIEYNCDPEGPVSANIWIDCFQGGSVDQGTICSNTIQGLPSPDGANIRFTGPRGDNNRIGLWSITGNLITNQMINVHIDHAHGISITGNTFIRGIDRDMIIDNSRNLLINSNVLHFNKLYHPVAERYQPGGITISNCDNLILSDNIIDRVKHRSEEAAVVVNESKRISLRGNHISNPEYRGIQINNSTSVLLTDTNVYEDLSGPSMLSSIELNGACYGTIIRHNSIMRGKNGDIVNNASGVVIEGNITNIK